MEDASEEFLKWMGKSTLLPRLATISFLLVVALILRTITDHGMVNAQIGSLLGMGYAALLIGIGGYKYHRSSHLAPVFAVCGALLMFSIVVELNANFKSLDSVPAYFLLVLTGIGLGSISYCFNAAPPILVGSLGMCLAGVIIDYPNPFFPHLAILLLVANLLGAFATRLQKCSWLRWILLLVTAVVVHVWALKLTIRWPRGGEELAALGPEWFLPLLFVFAAAFLGIAVLAVLRRWTGAERISKFDLALPTISAVWAFAMAGMLVRTRWETDLWLGWVSFAAAGGLLGFAAWLAKRKPGAGVTAFTVAGTVLGIVSLPAALGSPLAALPLVAIFAFGLIKAARQWRNGILRLLSYLVQIYACATMVMLLREIGAQPNVLGSSLVACLLAAVSFAHYRWCRKNPPTLEDRFFNTFDREDRAATLIFMTSLINGFFLLRAILHQGLVLSGGEIFASFQGGQSVLINLSAATLLMLSFRLRNREIRNVAVLVTLVGGLKVFIHDLFNFSGVPLVLAVFSFGLTVSLLSICLARWPSSAEREKETAEPVAETTPVTEGP